MTITAYDALRLSNLSLYELLFTHAGQLDTGLDQVLFLDLEECSFDLNQLTRFATFKYFQHSDRVIKIDFESYTDRPRLRSPLKIGKHTKLNAKLRVRNYYVLTTADLAGEQRRFIKYTPNDNYQFYLYERLTNVRSRLAEYADRRVVPNTEEVVIEKTVERLPQTNAYAYLYLDTALDTVDDNPNLFCSSKVILPSTLGGLVPARLVTYDMQGKSLPGIAWSLILACKCQQDAFVLFTLRGLVEEAFSRGYLRRQAVNNIEIVLDAFWGFEENFVPTANQDDDRRDIADNALLGWAICHALRYLQDRLPLNALQLDGQYSDFLLAVKQFALSLGYLCVYSISPVIWWCAERFELGAFNYESVSQKASYLTCIFLNELLQLQYDVFIHTQTARLYRSIFFSPTELKDSFYSDFNDSLSQAIAYKALWCWKFVPVILNETLSQYVFNQSIEDTYVAYLYRQVSNNLADSSPAAAALYEQYEEYFDLREIPHGVDTSFFLPLLLGLYSIKSEQEFYLYALEASAKVTYLLNDLRRMWPTGYQWINEDKLADVTTNLGSMLYAEASIYFDYYLTYFLVRDGLRVERSQGDQARSWANFFIPLKTGPSDYRLRSWTYRYLNRNVNQSNDLTQLLIDLFGYAEVSLVYLKPYDYAVLQDSSLTWDDFYKYTDEVNKFNGESFTLAEFRSIVYKPGFNVDLSQNYSVDLTEPINSYGDFILRDEPGFPYRNTLISYNTFLCSDSLTINIARSSIPTIDRLPYKIGECISDMVGVDLSRNYWYNDDLYILDGSSMLKSLHDYVPTLCFYLNASLAPNLVEVMKSSVAVGVTYKLIATSYSINTKNRIATDIWFLDDLDYLEPDVYT